jgi:hypothetical protein
MNAEPGLSEQDRLRAAEIGVAAIRAFYGSRAGDWTAIVNFSKGILVKHYAALVTTRS